MVVRREMSLHMRGKNTPTLFLTGLRLAHLLEAHLVQGIPIRQEEVLEIMIQSQVFGDTKIAHI